MDARLLPTALAVLLAGAALVACTGPPKSAAEARDRAWADLDRVLWETAETDVEADRRRVVAGDVARNTERWIEEVQVFWRELERLNAVYAAPRADFDRLVADHLARRAELRDRAFGALDRLKDGVDAKTWKQAARRLAVVLDAAVEDVSTDLFSGRVERSLSARVADPRRRLDALAVVERARAATADYSDRLGAEMADVADALLDQGRRSGALREATLEPMDGERSRMLRELVDLRFELRGTVRPDEWLAVFGAALETGGADE